MQYQHSVFAFTFPFPSLDRNCVVRLLLSKYFLHPTIAFTESFGMQKKPRTLLTYVLTKTNINQENRHMFLKWLITTIFTCMDLPLIFLGQGSLQLPWGIFNRAFQKWSKWSLFKNLKKSITAQCHIFCNLSPSRVLSSNSGCFEILTSCGILPYIQIFPKIPGFGVIQA